MASNNHPVEFYGKLVSQATKGDFGSVMQAQMCPFTHSRCGKIRKSAPEQTIGSCIVGYQGAPLIICPRRFLQAQQIFHDCQHLLSASAHYTVIPEVSMPGGSIDYFLVGLTDGIVDDFLGIEIQSLDTTGSGAIWQAREAVLRGGLADSYAYGINWKMSAKTILIQMLHKAASFEALGKKLVLIIQKEFADYLDSEFQTGQLRATSQDDPIHFHIYDVAESDGMFHLSLHERKNTDVSGIERMLNVGRDTNILLEDVIARVTAKLPGFPLVSPRTDRDAL